MNNQSTAYKLAAEYNNVLVSFYKSLMLGCNGQSYARLYLDLHTHEIFSDVQVACNNYLYREDRSLAEIAHDAGWGMDLTDDEVKYLNKYGVSDFGFDVWVSGYLVHEIETALDDWSNRDTEGA